MDHLQHVCEVLSHPSEQCITTLIPFCIASATKMAVSITDLICRSQPLPSIPFRNAFIDGSRSSQAACEKSELVLRLLKCIRVCTSLTINQLLQTTTHHMNIFNSKKMKFYIFIINFIFITFALRFIYHCINL